MPRNMSVASGTQESLLEANPRLQLLESYLGVPLFGHKHLSEVMELAEKGRTEYAGFPNECCVIFEVDQGKNAVLRIAKLIRAVYKLRSAQNVLCRTSGIDAKVIGVYPTIENPIVVFEIDSPAGEYTSTHIIPQSIKQPVAFIKYAFEKAFNVNPGMAGVGMVVKFHQ